MRNSGISYVKLIPVLLAFFVMGFVDLVGIAANYVKEDFHLTDTMANMFPSMVFFWFLICSVPTGILMNRIGRRKTVLLSLVITSVSLVLPLVDYTFTVMLLSFSLLGIGNAIMQVSLNPLVSNIVTGNKLASMLTFGQFVKAIASFSAPLLAAWAAVALGDWRMLFPIFMVVSIVSVLLLGLTNIREDDEKGENSTFKQCFALLGDGLILLSFIGIMCHVGIDVGTNVTAPKILIERLGMTLDAAGFATSIYFLFRTIGCLSGTFILAKIPAKIFFTVSIIIMLLGMGGLFFVDTLVMIYICVALIGFGNSNVFPIIFSQALFHMPHKKNEVSGLMIMGLFGGTVFPLLMGVASDALSAQAGAVMVMAAGVIYLLYFATKIRKQY